MHGFLNAVFEHLFVHRGAHSAKQTIICLMNIINGLNGDLTTNAVCIYFLYILNPYEI